MAKQDLDNLKKVATKVKSYVDTKTGGLSTSLANEISDRKAADESLQTNIEAETTRAKGVEEKLDARTTTIENKIPTQASATNQLADKDFVNSSITTATATFRGTVDTIAKLKALTGDLNDYAFLKVVDSTTGLVKQYDRYKYSTSSSTASTTGNWEFEYTLNNSSFTDAQWKAITSGVTSSTVTQVETNKSNISSHTSNTSNPHKVTATQVGLGNVDNTSDLNKPISTATQTALDNKVSLSGNETVNGIKTFTSEIKANQIANENDNAMLRYKSTENKVVLGGSTIPTIIMGSGDRPTYSKNGSDFDGEPLALLSDVKSEIEDGSVTTAKLADGAVTTDKIADGTITSSKLKESYALVSDLESEITTREETDNSLQTNIDNVSAKIDALDMTEVKPSASETLSSIKQVDGKVSVVKQTISISQTQINDSATGDEVTTMLAEVFD